MPGKRDRTTGLPIPSPVVPPSNICFQVTIPNASEYRQALRGVLSELGKPWTWRMTSGETNEAAYEAAELWREALSTAVYIDECGVSMSCEDVADCIETSEAVETAINNIINNQSNTQITYDTANQGVRIPLAERQETLIPASAGCVEDNVFGSVTSIVTQLDANNLDFLQIMEVGTNTRERVSTVLAAIPILETLPVNEIIDFVDKAQSEITEHYEAQWTTALRDEYRCDLFCIALENPDCALSFDDLFNYFNNRLGASLDPLNFLQSLTEFFLLGTWAGTEVVDIMMLIQIGVWREASNWLGVGLRTLQTVGLLGANDPDHDWAVIPCDCAPIEDPIITVVPAYATWTGNPEFLGNEDGGSRWRLTFTTAEGITAITVQSQVDGTPACVFVADGTGTATSYQHAYCPGGLTSGSGLGVNPALPVGPSLGWYGVDGNTIEVLLKT